jgi:serine/threonine protein kinase
MATSRDWRPSYSPTFGVPTVRRVAASNVPGPEATTRRSSVPPRRSGIRSQRIDLGVFELDETGWQDQPAGPKLEPEEGMLIAARYRLHEMVGEGGMGQVWSAFDEILYREVAVKIAGDEQTDVRIEREARIAANVRSRHVPPIHDFGFFRGTRYLVMERLRGEDLRARLERTRRLRLGACADLAAQAGGALDDVHATGAVHRDVSPANLFYKKADGGETLLLIDFGIACSTCDFGPKLTSPGTAVGCPDFVAPEQLMGDPAIDGRADVFSLAVVLYLAVVGELPFPDALHHTSRNYGRASRARTTLLGCMPHLDGFFSRALAYAPRDRFASGGELANAFSSRL